MWIRLALLLALLLAPACSRRSGDEAAQGRAAATVQARAWTEIRDGALLVDVRTQAEYAQGHLEGALLIPYDQIGSRASELGTDKTRPIVLYCRTGHRAGIAKQTLDGLGYTQVLNAGGYEGMKQVE